jgi:hypothetical protein
MDFAGILLLIFLGYRNNIRAKAKGQNGLVWAFLTVAAYIFCESIGLLIVVSLFCRDVVNIHLLTHNSGNFDVVSKQFNQQVARALLDNPLRELAVVMFGMGGYLFVRYLLEKRPDKKQPKVQHADNKMGEQ